MRTRVSVALLGVALAAPVDAQIADRLEDRGRAGRASGVGAAIQAAALCARYEWNGAHLWFDFGWVSDNRRGSRHDDWYDDWYDDDGHRDWRYHERDRARCADAYRVRVNAGTFYEREHARLHEALFYEHLAWHRKHDRRKRNNGWFRSHEAMHDRLARDHDRWHRDMLRERDRYYGIPDHRHRPPGHRRGTGSH